MGHGRLRLDRPAHRSDREQLAEAVDLQAGWRVLDVATGSGNGAIAAARRNAETTGLDYVPALLERAQSRAEAESLRISWIEGDAEDLPFEDGTFDAVLSIFGAMFAPDHQRTAQELARVCRAGGRIALCSWTPDGFSGELFKASARYNRPQPGLTPPVRWGTDAHLAELFAGRVRVLSSAARTFYFRFVSAEALLARFRAQFGPTIKAFQGAGSENEALLARDILELVHRFDRNRSADGPVAVAAEYLETVLVRE